MTNTQAIKTLEEWCRSLGGVISECIAFQTIAHQGVGGIATQEVASTDVVLDIPIACLITAQTAKCDTVVGSAMRAVERELKRKQTSSNRSWSDEEINNALLVVYLAYQRSLGEQSKWVAYINALPEVYSTPLWYTAAQLQLLGGTPIRRELVEFRASYEAIELEIIPALLKQLHPRTTAETNTSPLEADTVKAQKGISGDNIRDNLLWAYSAFWSRALCVTVNSMNMPAMVPVLDLLNHRPGSPTVIKARTMRDQGEKTRVLSLTCGYRIAQGEQVCIDYGPKANGDLLLHFGFALENNIADIYNLQYRHQLVDPPAIEGYPEQAQRIRLFRGDDLPLDLLNAARTAVADESERGTLRKRKLDADIDYNLIDAVYGTKASNFIQESDWTLDHVLAHGDKGVSSEAADNNEHQSEWQYYDVGELIGRANEERALLHIQAILDAEHAKLPARQSGNAHTNTSNNSVTSAHKMGKTEETEESKQHAVKDTELSVSWMEAQTCASVYIEGLHCILDDVRRNVATLLKNLKPEGGK